MSIYGMFVTYVVVTCLLLGLAAVGEWWRGDA